MDSSSVPDHATWLADSTVAFLNERQLFPPEPDFEFPFGVVPSFAKGPVDPGDVRAGFRSVSEDGLFTIEANVSAERLLAGR